MDALTFLKKTTELGASDLFIVAGLPLSYKKSGQLIELTSERIMPENTEILIREIYSLAGDRDISHFLKTGDDDFSFAVSGLSRFRVNTYMQRSSMAAVIRVITFHLPNPSDLGIPPEIIDLGWFLSQVLQEVENPPRLPVSLMQLTAQWKSILLLLKTLLNFFTAIRKAS
mgnify:CR=1 FL=1